LVINWQPLHYSKASTTFYINNNTSNSTTLIQ
jgi:hypothetical protein